MAGISRGGLLNSLLLTVPPNQGVEDRQHVAAVFHHTEEDISQLRIAFGVAMPFGENRRRHFDISAKLFRGVAAQKETVEKGRFPLGKGEV